MPCTLTFEHYCSKTGTKRLVSVLNPQEHHKDKVIELFAYEYDRRGNRVPIPNGTVNARKHDAKIFTGTDPMGHIYSFALVYAKFGNFDICDHLIANFSGYSDGEGSWTSVISLPSTIAYEEVKKKSPPVVDDEVLLLTKYNEICT